MAWFKRNRDQDAAQVDDVDGTEGAPDAEPDGTDVEDADEVDEQAEQARTAAEHDRREHGPFDLSETDEDDGAERIDLGALRLPGRDGMELRLEIEDKTQRVIAVTIALGGSTLQLQAFAAPRTLGVWDDIRAEIGAQVTKQGGTADEVPGVFGRELIARIPVRTADGRTGHQASRFVGVDGPRWFLRGVFGGPASHDHDAAAPLEDLLRSSVVVRGTEAMAPRDLLPLTLPAAARPATPGAVAAGGAAVATSGTGTDDGTDDAAADRTDPDDLAPFERGPEITERR